MLVGQVSIVNRLRHQPQPGIFETEVVYQRFKSAIVADVTKAVTRVEHVEGNRLGVPLGVGMENEFCFGIDITAYQPRRGDTVDARLWTSNPCPPSKVFPAY